jgi:hypothetical protein
VNILSYPRALSASRAGLVLAAALAAVSSSSADVADPTARLPSLIQKLPAKDAESPELREVGFVSPTLRGAGGSIWL